MNKNILHRIDFKEPKIELVDSVIKIEQNIATQIVEKVDKEILDLLYNFYKDTKCNTLIVLDKSEFKHFLLKYLPMYLEGR